MRLNSSFPQGLGEAVFRRTVSAVMLAMLLTSTLALAFNIQPVKARTIVVPDDYPTIQEAINNANAGDTVFVRNGTYYEHVCVNTTVSIAGQDRTTTTIDGNQTGTVVTVTADNVNISGFTVQNGEAGLDLAGDGNTVTSSMFSSNGAVEIDLKADLEVYQDPWQPLAWHYPIGLMNGSYTEVMELTTETPVISVEAFGHSDVEDLLLGLFYDENMDGAPQLHEFVGFGCDDKNPWTCLFGPPKGQYIIKIKGQEVTGNPGHFDRKITRYKGYGIGAHSCLNNTLSENLISGNYAGLYVQSSSGMVVHSNNVTKNIGGIVTENMTNSIFCSNMVFANTPHTYSTGISIRAAENVNLSSNVVSHNAFGINIWNSTNTSIENNEVYSHSGWAVELHASYGNKVANNCISNVSALDGIRLMFSSGNSLTGNNITACEHSGILLWHDCDNNTATCNNIQLSGSLGVIPGHGVEILLSHNNTFSNNVFSHGSNQGLVAIESSDNTVTANLVSSNRKGIVLRDSIRNRVYHNSIIDNWEQQGFDDTGENTWDDGYPSGGNYWSDYAGVDFFRGVYQNESGSDGMGDTSYNQDNYPLMNPWPSGWKLDFTVSTNHPIVDFAGYNGSLYAAANNKLYVKEGSSWNVIDAPTFVTSLEPYGGKLVVSGKGGLYCYDGTSFSLIFSVPTYIGVLGAYNNTLYAGTMLGNPPKLYYCNGSAENSDDWHIDTGFSTTLNFSGAFGSIDSFAVYNGKMYVASGKTVYCFDGTSWSVALSYEYAYAFSDMQVYNGKLYLATRDQGWRKPIYQGGTGFSGRVIEFDGENWTTVLDHDYWIYSLGVYDGKLYAGTANKIFAYNGTSWETSFNATEGAYYALCFENYDGKIYAGMGNGCIFADPAPAKANPETIVVPEFSSNMILAVFTALTMLAAALIRKKRARRLS
jgi:parallel beta-helix repeat protein